MLTFVIRRVLLSVPVLIATSFIIFTFVTIAGDPLAELRMDPRTSEQTLERIIERKHLDEPLLVQYGYWVKDALFNGFGTDLGGSEIWPDLTRVLGNTLQFIVLAEVLAVLLGIGLGVYSAMRQYSVFDHAATTFSFVAFSMPIFWFALLMQIVVTNLFNATGFRLFYTGGLSSPGLEDPSFATFLLDRFQHLALPVIVLSVAFVASYSRYMRASMLEVVNADYVRTARAKGLRERHVVFRHAFRNALIPLATVVALDFGAIFGGAVVTESIFSLDGMGLYFIRALGERDVYPIMAWLMLTSVIVVLFNLLADVMYAWLDPRIRLD